MVLTSILILWLAINVLVVVAGYRRGSSGDKNIPVN